MDFGTAVAKLGGTPIGTDNSANPMATNQNIGQSSEQPMSFSDAVSKLGGTPINSLHPTTQDNRNIEQKIGDTLSNVFAGKQIGEGIGTLYARNQAETGAGQTGVDYSKLTPEAIAKLQSEDVPTSLQAQRDEIANNIKGPTGLQIGGDIGQAALDILAPGIGNEGSVAAKVGTNAALGAGFGATSALANGATKPGDIAAQSGFGAILGGGAAGLGELISKAADSLPPRIINQVLPQLKNPDTIDYALNNLKLGTVDGMIEHSQKALNSYDSQINAILQHPDFELGSVNGGDILGDVINQFPNSEYTPESVISKMKSQLPDQAKIFTTLSDGGDISLADANTLRQKIDRITYKTAIDSPEVKAGKDVAAAFGNTLRSFVQDTATETQPIFSNYSKEINVMRALKKLSAKGDKAAFVNMKDLLFSALGGTIGGLPGAVASGLTEKVVSSPVAKIGSAKAIRALSPTIKNAATIGRIASAVAGKINIKK